MRVTVHCNLPVCLDEAADIWVDAPARIVCLVHPEERSARCNPGWLSEIQIISITREADEVILPLGHITPRERAMVRALALAAAAAEEESAREDAAERAWEARRAERGGTP